MSIMTQHGTTCLVVLAAFLLILVDLDEVRGIDYIGDRDIRVANLLSTGKISRFLIALAFLRQLI